MTLLGRLLDVGAALQRWDDGDQIGGGIAADGLDQARGHLEDLANGGAMALLAVVDRIASSLPPTME
jgi:hypothetical protein